MRATRPFRRLGAIAAFAAGVLLTANGADGQPPKGGAPKEFTAKGKVQLGIHRIPMEVGKLYLVRVEANGFTPAVSIRPGMFASTGESFVQGDSFVAYVLPTETREYRLTVHPDTNDEEVMPNPYDYALTVTTIPMAATPLLQKEAKLTPADPPYKNAGGNGDRGPHKAFDVNFKAGQVYIITVDAAKNQQFDPYLQVEGAGGKVLAKPNKLPKRGEQAVFADAEGVVFGVIKSSSGDIEDFLPGPGDWIWVQLLSRDARRAAEFYEAVGGYEIVENTTTNKLNDYVLVSKGFARATVRTIRSDDARVRPTWLPFVRVQNIGESVMKAKQLGGNVLVEPKPELLDGKVALIADPTGAAIGIMEWPEPLEKGAQKP